MKVLATVGTGRFEALVKALDERPDPRLLIQHGAGPAPRTNKGVAYIPALDDRLDDFDLVISHAGAGTVYALLDRGQPFCVVPNLDRTDDHQSDIANFLRGNTLAPVVDLRDGPLDIEALYEAAQAICGKHPYPGPTFDFDRFIDMFLSEARL
jgi:beta-1,4-N-acetylglucosaminyltransferase